LVYLRAATRAARYGAPRPAPLSLAVVAAVAIALPLAAGTAWFGHALVGIAGTTGLAVAQAMLIDVASPQAISVPLVTAVAGVIVVVVVHQAMLTRELAVSRRTAERLAVEAERLRLARYVAVIDLDCPGTRVVVLTSHEGDADIFPAIHIGALSHLLKEATPDELAAAYGRPRPAKRCCTLGWRLGWSPSCGAAMRRHPTRCGI
jgi:hypothetical protein